MNFASNEYKDIIRKVQKPSQYLGNEINSIHKFPFTERGDGVIKIALIFPDLYEMGMSHLGLKILYHIINLRDDAVAERVFAPDTDYEELLRPMGNFLRVNKSMLINIHHILNYTKGSTCFIDMKHNKEGIEVSRRKKTEIVQFLKNWG